MNYYDNFNVSCRYVRTCILYMFCSVLFIYLIGRYVSLIYLTLLDGFDVIPTYSWRSTILVCLFKHLCIAFMKWVKWVEGCLLLL
jgi:hypothetical protein